MLSAFAAHMPVPALSKPSAKAAGHFLRKLLVSLQRAPDDSAPPARIGSIRHTPLAGVSVWYLWHTDQSQLAEFNHGLTSADFAEFADIRNPAVRARSLRTRGLLRAALSEAANGDVRPSEWVFERGAHGKPHLLNPPIKLHFSCSHTPMVSIVAVSRTRPVGIDIETAFSSLDDPSLIEEFFTAAERQAIQCIPLGSRAKARTRLWTLKEAVVKMLGTGLALDVSKLEFDIEEDRLKSSRDPEIDISGVRLATWLIPNHVQPLSVALAIKN
jgi:4'-phosphopantetheinyl transferase